MAQFAPVVIGGLFWKGGTRNGALAGLAAGALLWAYTLMLPSIAKSGWLPAGSQPAAQPELPLIVVSGTMDEATCVNSLRLGAADYLLKKKMPGIYRVHEHPAEERLDELRAGLAVDCEPFDWVLDRPELWPQMIRTMHPANRRRLPTMHSPTNKRAWQIMAPNFTRDL